MNRIVLAVVYMIVFIGCEHHAQPHSQPEQPKPNSVLDIAKQLAATRYHGWTFGENNAERQINCVQFVAAVVLEIEPYIDTKDFRKQIYIDNLAVEEKNQEGLKRLLESKDERMTGIKAALVDNGIGEAISVSDVQPGDFVQYWIYLKNGNVMGHSAIIESIRRGENGIEARLYGSHKSTNGIATTDFWLPLEGKDRRVFPVRISQDILKRYSARR